MAYDCRGVAEVPVPLYRETYDKLREAVRNGDFRYMLPPEPELTRKYGVSRGTLREAVRLLEIDGWVKREQGRGTVILREADSRGRRPDPPISAQDNFDEWKSLVKLPPQFPRLLPLRWEELDKQAKMYIQHPRQTREVEKILLAAETRPSLQPYTVVMVNRGHGCTTLFRYVFRQLIRTPPREDVPPRIRSARVIPVRVTWSRLADADDLPGRLEQIIRADILWGLLSDQVNRQKPWDPPVKFARLIGALSNNVEHQRKLLAPLVAQNDLDLPEPPPPALDWEQIRGIAPRLVEQPIATLMQTLWHELEIYALLMFDLSLGEGRSESQQGLDASMRDRLDLLTVTVKNLQEQVDGTRPGAFFSELYFLDSDKLDFIRSVYDIAPEVIEYPHFEQADIFGIMTRHYPLYPLIEVMAPNEPSRRYFTEDLAAIFQSNFLIAVRNGLKNQGKGFQHLSLTEIAVLLEKRILAEMARPWSEISYHLTPSSLDGV